MIRTLFLVTAVWLCFHMLTTLMFCFLISWMEVDLTAMSEMLGASEDTNNCTSIYTASTFADIARLELHE